MDTQRRTRKDDLGAGSVTSQRIRQLDIIRVIGVVCVIAILHATHYVSQATGTHVVSGPLYFAIESTALGLVFYVSGYAIGGRYGALAKGEVRRFLRRRLVRLWPFYAVVLTAFWILWFGSASPAWVVAQYACIGPFVVRWLGRPVLTLWFIQVLLAYHVAFALVASRGSRSARLGSLALMAGALLLLSAFDVVDSRLLIYAPAFVFGVWSSKGLRDPAAQHTLVVLATTAYLVLGVGGRGSTSIRIREAPPVGLGHTADRGSAHCVDACLLLGGTREAAQSSCPRELRGAWSVSHTQARHWRHGNRLEPPSRLGGHSVVLPRGSRALLHCRVLVPACERCIPPCRRNAIHRPRRPRGSRWGGLRRTG